jgi:hypothetical protein
MKDIYTVTGNCRDPHGLPVQSGELLIVWMKELEDSTLVLGDGEHSYVRKNGVVSHYYNGTGTTGLCPM